MGWIRNLFGNFLLCCASLHPKINVFVTLKFLSVQGNGSWQKSLKFVNESRIFWQKGNVGRLFLIYPTNHHITNFDSFCFDTHNDRNQSIHSNLFRTSFEFSKLCQILFSRICREVSLISRFIKRNWRYYKSQIGDIGKYRWNR